MESTDLKTGFWKDGYVIVKGVVAPSELQPLRQAVLAAFDARHLAYGDAAPQEAAPTEQLRPSDLLEHLPGIVKLQFAPAILAAARQIYGDNFSYVNDFHIQRNQRLIPGSAGWHIDAGSNFALRYLNNALGVNEFRFGKIGVYLQSGRCPVGGSIDLIPKSHRIGRIFRSLVLRLLESRFNRKLSGSGAGLGVARLLGAISLDELIEPGDCVIFDCRLVHRSSPAPARPDLAAAGDSFKDKLTAYWELGDGPSTVKFLRNDLVRALAHENVPRRAGQVKSFSHYLRLKYPNDYPAWYVEQVNAQKVNVAQFENERDLDIARRIYA